MEALNLLKFWRNAGGDNVAGTDVNSNIDYVNSVYDKSTTIDVRNRALETDDLIDGDDDSFFELELTNTDCKEKELNAPQKSKDDGIKLVESPKDVFRNGRVFPLDSNDSSKPHSQIAVLKSAPKFKVFMLGFRKSSKTETGGGDLTSTPKEERRKSTETGQSKRFAVKCTVDEAPIFSRENCLRNKLLRESLDDFSIYPQPKRSGKEAPKYLKLIKPFYSRTSKRHNGDKMRFPDQFSMVSPRSSPATAPSSSPRKVLEEKQWNNRAAGLKVVYKRLGKSRSTSSAVGMTPSVNRRDDSLLLQHDGIQSAILHCKRSYSSSGKEYSGLSRCVSDSTHEISVNQPRNSIEELKRCSI